MEKLGERVLLREFEECRRTKQKERTQAAPVVRPSAHSIWEGVTHGKTYAGCGGAEETRLNSLVLAIELFNRLHDAGRAESVVMLLHRAFEMLLTAIIKDKAGTVHAKGERYSYGFNQCLEVAQNALKVISADERTTLWILDAHRETVVHYYQEVSEGLFSLQAQAVQ